MSWASLHCRSGFPSLTSRNAVIVPGRFLETHFLSGRENGRVLGNRAQNGRVPSFGRVGIASIFLLALRATVTSRGQIAVRGLFWAIFRWTGRVMGESESVPVLAGLAETGPCAGRFWEGPGGSKDFTQKKILLEKDFRSFCSPAVNCLRRGDEGHNSHSSQNSVAVPGGFFPKLFSCPAGEWARLR